MVIAADIFYGNSVTASFVKCLPHLMSPDGACYAMLVLERDDKAEFERLAQQAGFRSLVRLTFALWLWHVLPVSHSLEMLGGAAVFGWG